MKPILFNTEMVRAIQNGTKTATRRVVKPRYGGNLEVHDDPFGTPRLSEKCGCLCRGLKPPYLPGDILYVRETWQYGFGGTCLYKASAGHDLFMTPDGKLVSDIPWRPSIHMPREAARIFLRVTDVRVERLWEITAEQCVSEGLGREPLDEVGGDFMRGMFHDLWDSTIQKADRALYGWAANPWVWVISFERIGREEAELCAGCF